ncbi:MAG: CoA transferase [Deltaproteobacteria bacterium]|nr:CoA transferase [Deltaproteobacteria bacterium]MBW2136306.1 CoA transferase [Deltaproteobacteria bacterium]
MDRGALTGLRVIDLGRVLAGPYATRVLADFGAEVIKVQSRKTATGAESNGSAYFRHWNRNKRSVTLDMSHPESRDLLLKLISKCDILVENFSSRVMANWELDYEVLRSENPGLIMLSMSAAGQTGPWKDLVAFGPTIQSLGGLSYLTSYSGDHPTGLSHSYGDIIAGLYGAIAVLVALEHRKVTGKGMLIDLSEYEALCTALGPTLMDASVNGSRIRPRGNHADHIPAAPYGCYRCKGEDRWCVIAVFNEEEWQALCRLMGRPEWSREGRFSCLSRRRAHRDVLDRLLEEWTARFPAEELVELLQRSGVPSGIVQGPEDLLEDPQLAARGFFSTSSSHDGRNIFVDAYPIRSRNWKKGPVNPAPQLGEDNDYVFRELLGLKEEEVSYYVTKGVIG